MNDSIKSNGMAFAAYGAMGAVSSSLDGYDKSRTLFSFSTDGERIFAFVRSAMGETLDLCSNNINEKEGYYAKYNGETVDTVVKGIRSEQESGILSLSKELPHFVPSFVKKLEFSF